MTAPPVPSPRASLLDKFAAWILDHDGTMYGDERQRTLWYEGIALTSSVQLLLVPWALAVLVWLGEPAFSPTLMTVLMAFWLPTLLCVRHVARHRVPTGPVRWSRKAVLVSVVSGLPYVLFFAGLLREDFDIAGPAGLWGLAGGLIGATIAAVSLYFVRRQRLRREQAAGEAD